MNAGHCGASASEYSLYEDVSRTQKKFTDQLGGLNLNVKEEYLLIQCLMEGAKVKD